MKQPKYVIIFLLIISSILLISTLFLAFQNFAYSFEVYALKFQLGVAHIDINIIKQSIPKYDRYDAYKQLTSLACFKDYNQQFSVNEDNDPKYWWIQLKGYVTNPKTGETSKDHLSTLGNYLVDKETGEVLTTPSKSKNICNLNIEDAKKLVKELPCVQTILNRKEEGIVASSVEGLQDPNSEELFFVVVQTTRTPGITAKSAEFTVNKFTGEILSSSSTADPKILCDGDY